MERDNRFKFSEEFMNKVMYMLGAKYIASDHIFNPAAIINIFDDTELLFPYRYIFKWCRCIGFIEYEDIIVPVVEVKGVKPDGDDPYKYTINSIKEDANSACLIIGYGIYDNFKDNFAEVIGPLLLSAFAPVLSPHFFRSQSEYDLFAMRYVGFEKFYNARLEVNKLICSEDKSSERDPVVELNMRLRRNIIYPGYDYLQDIFQVELFDEPDEIYYFRNNKEKEIS